MKILNIMLGQKLGGLEQVFADYSYALSEHNHHIISVLRPHAAITNKIKGDTRTISQFTQFDPFAIYKLRQLISQEKPDCLITHGNRATTLARRTYTTTPIIAVCHNYKYKPLIGSDALIALTPDIKDHVIAAGQPADKVYIVPNMIRLDQPPLAPQPFRNPSIIGFMGRFVQKKAVDLFLRALVLLKNNHVPFKAHIAGDGPLKDELHKLTQQMGLSDEVSFLGWATDKKEFFDSIDIFCLPSSSEPFGLVLLEAFAHGKAVAATASTGPLSIATNGLDILFSPIGDENALSLNLIRLTQEPELAQKMAGEGAKTVMNYTPDIIGERLHATIMNIIEKVKK